MFGTLKKVLSKTTSKISSSIDRIFSERRIDESSLEQLEELLLSSDVGSPVTTQLIKHLKSLKLGLGTSLEVKERLAEETARILSLHSAEFTLRTNKLDIILVCGVNGSGKTTTVGKLAELYVRAGKKTAVAACDTFRAAAIEQLEGWADRTGATLIRGESDSDPASIAYKAIAQAQNNGTDLLFIDTAGRLHNYKNLMDELSKMIRVIQKFDSSAPHQSLLVLDATCGQNMNNQVESFMEYARISGLVITKLDGTAKGGAVINAVQKFRVPVFFVAFGEQTSDIKKFDPVDFSRSLIGL